MLINETASQLTPLLKQIFNKGRKLMMKKGVEYVKISSRFPQLKSSHPDDMLREINRSS